MFEFDEQDNKLKPFIENLLEELNEKDKKENSRIMQDNFINYL